MLAYQKNTLLAMLSTFKAKLYDYANSDVNFLHNININIIDRNLTSIEKQIKKI